MLWETTQELGEGEEVNVSRPPQGITVLRVALFFETALKRKLIYPK